MSDLFDLVRRVGEDAGGTMAVLEILLRVTLLLAAAVLLVLGLRRTSASLRHLVWTLSLAGTLLIPLFSWAFPAWRLAILPQPEAASLVSVMEQAADGPDAPPTKMGLPPSNAFDSPVGESLDLSTSLSGADTESQAGDCPNFRSTKMGLSPSESPWPAMLAIVWAAGTSLGLGWLGVGVAGAWYVTRQCAVAGRFAVASRFATSGGCVRFPATGRGAGVFLRVDSDDLGRASAGDPGAGRQWCVVRGDAAQRLAPRIGPYPPWRLLDAPGGPLGVRRVLVPSTGLAGSPAIAEGERAGGG